MAFTPPAGAKPNEQGFYTDAGGNLLPGQSTPGQLAADKMGLTPQYDPKKGLWYTNPVVNGRQGGVNYISPSVMAGLDKKPQAFKDSSGAFVHHPEWNNHSGEWDHNINWGNVLALAAGGALTMGGISAAMGGGEAAAAAVPGANVPSSGLGGFLGDGAVIGGVPSELPGAVAAIPEAGAGAEAAGGPVLESISAGPGSTSLPAGGTAPGMSGEGVQNGLLPSHSMESAADVYEAGGGPGTSNSILQRLMSKEGMQAMSTVLGGAARSGAASNQVRDTQNINYENAKLNRDKFALTAPGIRAKQSILGSLGSNFTPSTLDWGPGGFHPGGVAGGAPLPTVKGGGVAGMQNLDPSTKALLQELIKSNLQNNTNNQDDVMSTPPPGGESTTDKVLGGASMGSTLMSLIAPSILGRARANTTAPPVPGTPGLSWDDMMEG